MKRAFCMGMILLNSMTCASQTGTKNVVVSDLDGNQLLRFCLDSGRNDEAFCLGFILGTRDGAVLATEFRDAKPILDMPMEVKQEQMRDIVVKYLNEHPEVRHKPAGLLVILALSKSFPPHS